jgi:hypothetical protein
MNTNQTEGSNTAAPRSVRFWVFENGDFVRLTLRPGAELVWRYWRADEEGGTAGCDVYRLEEIDGRQCVRCDWGRRARDCDGVISESGACVADVDRLQDREPYVGEGETIGTANIGGVRGGWVVRIRVPTWDRLHVIRRDNAAEAAGY